MLSNLRELLSKLENFLTLQFFSNCLNPNFGQWGQRWLCSDYLPPLPLNVTTNCITTIRLSWVNHAKFKSYDHEFLRQILAPVGMLNLLVCGHSAIFVSCVPFSCKASVRSVLVYVSYISSSACIFLGLHEHSTTRTLAGTTEQEIKFDSGGQFAVP